MPARGGPPPRPLLGHVDDRQFATKLKELRRWSCLSLMSMASKNNLLKKSTTSDYLLGKSWPDWTWVYTFVFTCLDQGTLSPGEIEIECRRWSVAWTTVDRQRLSLPQWPANPHNTLEEITADRPQADLDTRLSPSPDTVPRQLPIAPRNFAGRAAELFLLDAQLEEHLRTRAIPLLITICGQAGIGKTALGVHWASQIARHFPDGQLYINLKGFDRSGSPISADEAVRELLSAFEVPLDAVGPHLETQAKKYRSLIAGKRILILLDNARDADQVRPLLPSHPQALTIVTSRNWLGGLIIHEHAQPVELGLLSEGEAWELLAGRLGAGRLRSDPQSVEDLVEYCSGLPLALSIFAARASGTPELPLSILVGELHETRDRLDAFDGGEIGTDLRAVFSWSIQSLSSDAALMFRLLAAHPGPDISRSAAACLIGIPERQAVKLLDEIKRVHLVDRHVSGRYYFHDLTRAYATEELELTTLGKDATRRALDYYLHTAYAADRLLDPHRDLIAIGNPATGVSPGRFTDSQQALQWFTTERQVLVKMINEAIKTSADRHVWQIPWSVASAFDYKGYWHDLATMQQAALAAAGRLNDPLAQCWTNLLLGHAQARLRQHQKAATYLAEALRLAGDIGDQNLQARTQRAFALNEEQQDNYASALEHSQAMLDLYRAAGNRAQEAMALNWVGWFHTLLSGHEAALPYCEQALSLAREIGDRHVEAMTEDSLGYIHHKLGNYTKALACYERGLDVIRKVGDHYNEAQALEHIAATHVASGNHQAALENFELALEIYQNLGHPNAEAIRVQIAETN